MNNIASERTRLGLTQTDLAQRLEKSRKTVGDWEAENVAIPSDAVCTMAVLFNCSTDYLLGLSDRREGGRE